MGLAVLLLRSATSDGTAVAVIDGEDYALVDEIYPAELASCTIESGHPFTALLQCRPALSLLATECHAASFLLATERHAWGRLLVRIVAICLSFEGDLILMACGYCLCRMILVFIFLGYTSIYVVTSQFDGDFFL
jgi:hypothetical protein